LRYRTVTVKIRYDDFSTVQRSKSIPVETDDVRLLERLAIEIFDQKRNPIKPIRLVGVKASGLSDAPEQSCLTEFI
jgi:DNA polymerase-4